jgi:hypothetical protein
MIGATVRRVRAAVSPVVGELALIPAWLNQ